MYFRGPHGRLALPNESPSLNKANLLTYLLWLEIIRRRGILNYSARQGLKG